MLLYLFIYSWKRQLRSAKQLQMCVCVGGGGVGEKKKKRCFLFSQATPPLDGLIDRSVLPLLMITKVEHWTSLAFSLSVRSNNNS